MDAQQAASELTRLINGFQISQIIHTAASLGIADVLKNGARPSTEIARATGAQPGPMYRLLHALASVGVLEEGSDAHFALTPMGECLRSDAPRPRAAWARYIGRPHFWRSWGEMRHTVMTGETAFQHVHGKGLWEWRARQPEETAIFDAAMAESSGGAATAIAEAFDFSRFGCIMDVGGGHGALLARILRGHPACRGILFDLPHVVAGATGVLQANGVADRCAVVAGSMFAGIPAGADAYVIMQVMMDHDDDEARTILRSCRSVIGSDGRLIVIEPLMPEPNKHDPRLSDMTMLIMTGGHLRTSAEFMALFVEAGFELEQSVATGTPLTMLIGGPV